MGSYNLSPLQRELAAAFSARTSHFYLTGGAALVGFYLHHRLTDDLDFFTQDRLEFERAQAILTDAASSIGATVVFTQGSHAFHRALATRENESVVFDLVYEPVVQVCTVKPRVEGIAVDPVEEIMANKLTALVGRAEERDIIDVMFLEQTGLRVEDHLDAALKKDGGCTPATLSWLLSEVVIPETAQLPGGTDPVALKTYVASLVTRLRAKALPSR